MLIEAVIAGIVGAALLWLLVQPVVAPARASAVPMDLPEPEETARGQALLALKEIEFDRATGKLSDKDYTQLHDRYSRIAIAALDGDSACAQCGAPIPAETKYCTNCGKQRT